MVVEFRFAQRFIVVIMVSLKRKYSFTKQTTTNNELNMSEEHVV